MTEQKGEQTGQTEGERDGASGGSSASVQVVDNPEKGRFELRDGDDVIGVAAYALVPGGGADQRERVVFFHTEVRPEYEGQGLAARLASYALDRTVESGRAIVALCPYIKAYVTRHPEPYAAHLVAPTPAGVKAAERASAG
ncbi:GNAT family N-acetyltransferase [Terrabacter sp. BE26]|uniref:GNAT family N-acetyltransferase n=1 Tax=Terrabacter sp. BE26 TaxID=2898152 RepID=UPI0035BE6C63